MGTPRTAVNVIYQSSDLGPLTISFCRFLAGAALLVPVWVLHRSRKAPRTPQPVGRRVLLLAGTSVGLAVFQTAYFAAVQDTRLAVGTTVAVSTAPMFTATGGRVFLGKHIGRGGLLAVVGAMVGLTVLVLDNQPGASTPWEWGWRPCPPLVTPSPTCWGGGPGGTAPVRIPPPSPWGRFSSVQP
ncbi:DMT family transporter [Streptomyces sp. NPDC052042]|uniref:DMT family transporter n=1 Tax=Streptomyces sp. NPDC052042 TaxID=3365683 RepID=UPI0037D983F6